MKILIVTEKLAVGEDTFGYLHGHILDAARSFDMVTVVCLEKGQYKLPKSVPVFSLGKESGARGRLSYLMRFWGILWSERHDYDAVFVYLTPLYALAGSVIWKITGKKVVLWYNHTHNDWVLRAASRLVYIIAVPSEDKCPIKGLPKCVVLDGGLSIEGAMKLVRSA